MQQNKQTSTTATINHNKPQGLTYIPPEREDLRAMLVRWTPAFARALLCHLRKDGDFRAELSKTLLPHEVDQVLLATHRPNYVLQVLSEIVKEARAGAAPTMRMDDNITTFEDCLGGCERILKTPVPLSYTRHTSRFLMIWLTLLPFSLYGSAGVGTIPLSTIIAFLLLGIEEIGVSIEEPFSILALEAISDSVRFDYCLFCAFVQLMWCLGFSILAWLVALLALPYPYELCLI